MEVLVGIVRIVALVLVVHVIVVVHHFVPVVHLPDLTALFVRVSNSQLGTQTAAGDLVSAVVGNSSDSTDILISAVGLIFVAPLINFPVTRISK